MKKVTFFAAAAAATALIASPVLAKDMVQPHSASHAKMHKGKHHMKHSARMQTRDTYMRTSAIDRWDGRRDFDNRNWDNRGWDNRSSGFWPADVVGGAIGTAGAVAAGAVNTAGAIATAPFDGPYRSGYRDSYAYSGPGYADTYDYKGVAIAHSPNYAARNGFVCQPGTVFRAANGQPTICQ